MAQAVRQDWNIIEGSNSRSDGYSLHGTFSDLMEYLAQYVREPKNGVGGSGGLQTPAGEPLDVVISDGLFERLRKKPNMRFKPN